MSTVERHPATLAPIVLSPSRDRAVVRVAFRYPGSDGELLDATLYRKTHAAAPTPAVVMVTGYPDPGYATRMGCTQPEVAQYVSWAEHLAAAGLATITYRNRVPADAGRLLRHVHDHAATLGIAPDRIGLWACSGNAPNALALVADRAVAIRCAALCYGYLLDRAGTTHVASAASTWGFASPGTSISDLRRETALLVVRAGADAMPGLNATIDDFLADALRLDLALSFVNVAGAPHAFDVQHDAAASRVAIAEIVAFLRAHLPR